MMFGVFKKEKVFHLLLFIYNKRGEKGDRFDQCPFNS